MSLGIYRATLTTQNGKKWFIANLSIGYNVILWKIRYV